MPVWFRPGLVQTGLSYNRDPQRRQDAGSKARLRSAGRGQEFVIDSTDTPEVAEWLHGLFESG